MSRPFRILLDYCGVDFSTIIVFFLFTVNIPFPSMLSDLDVSVMRLKVVLPESLSAIFVRGYWGYDTA